MSWQERLSEAAYTSPGGTRLTFNYENVSRNIDKKTGAFDFPDANGTLVQDLGHTSRKYPLRLFFWGKDCDLEAAAFEAALLETGPGQLEHPIYGSLVVVPFGAITRRDDLKTAANQTIIEVTFWETISEVYPSGKGDPASDVIQSAADFNENQAAAFEQSTSLKSAIEKSEFLGAYNSYLAGAKTILQSAADVQADTQAAFNTIYDSINEGIDVLIAQPANLAFQTHLLMQSPAYAAGNIRARLTAYKDLNKAISSGNGAKVTPTRDSKAANQYQAADLFVTGSTAAAALSTVNATFDTKTEALETAEALLIELETVTAWRDDNYRILSDAATTASAANLDTGAAYQALQQTTAAAVKFLINQSFSLKQERRIVLDRPRAVIELTAQLYGEIDSKLDFFINSNNLTGSEIIELPRGREIVYYI